MKSKTVLPKIVLLMIISMIIAAGIGLSSVASALLANEQQKTVPNSQRVEGSGEVTFANYQASFIAYTECLSQTGWQFVQPPRLTSRNEYEFQLYRPGSDPAASAEEREHWDIEREQCRISHFDEIQRQWAIKNAMSPSERQVARDFLGQCLREAGYDAPAHPESNDWIRFARVEPGVTNPAIVRTFLSCSRMTAERFGLRAGEVP